MFTLAITIMMKNQKPINSPEQQYFPENVIVIDNATILGNIQNIIQK